MTKIATRPELASKKLKKLIKKSEIGGDRDLISSLIDQSNDAVFVVDPERNVLLFNRGAEQLTGFERNEVLGRHCLEGFKCTTCLASCSIFERGEFKDVPLTLFRKDGSQVDVRKSARVLRDDKGEVVGAVEVFRQAALADGALEAAPPDPVQGMQLAWQGLSAGMASLGRGVLVLDEAFKVLRASTALVDLLGADAEALAGRGAAELLGQDLFGEDTSLVQALRKGERREGLRARARHLRTGVTLPCSVSAAPMGPSSPCGDAGGARFLVVIRPETRAELEPGHAHGVVHFEGMVARSPAMLRVFQLIEHLRDSDATVLISGESGTGKELVARAVHARSARAAQPFVAINCGALPESLLESELFGHARGAFTGAVRDKPGRFEVVEDGTIFLDEIGDLPLPLQVKLLRVLQQRSFERVGENRSRPFRGRVVAATNLELKRAVEQGRFRQDLFYRLNVVPIVLPPLRQRREDIELLVEHLLERIGRHRARSLRLSPSLMRGLLSYDWPGNIRQLENALEYATAVCEGQTIHEEDLPPEVTGRGAAPGLPRDPASGAFALHEVAPTPAPPAALAAPHLEGYPTAQQVHDALRKHRFHRGLAAQELGISRTTLWRRLKELDAG